MNKDINKPIRLLTYASGKYYNICNRCKKKFIGDKRAVICLDCAIEISELYVQLNTIKDKYITLLEEEISELCSISCIHGWTSTRYEEGDVLRKMILSTLNKIEGV